MLAGLVVRALALAAVLWAAPVFWATPVFGQGKAEAPRLVRLAFTSGWDALPAVVAIERGFFVQEGLVVSGLAVANAATLINSMAAGSTDFALVPQRTLLVMAAGQLPVNVVSMSGWGTEMELVVPTAAKDAKLTALKGKRIAVLAGSGALSVLVRLLNRDKLRPTDVKIVQLAAADLTAAFEKKLADAIFETRHFTSVMVQNKQARVILPAKDVASQVGVIDGMPLIVRASAIKSEPETVQKFVNAWVKALLYIQQDPNDAAALMQIYFHRNGVVIPPDMTKSWVSFTKYNQYAWSKAAVIDAEYNGWALKVGNILKVEPKLDGYVDNSFVDRATKTLGVTTN